MSLFASRLSTATTARTTRSKRGFALLITITLLAFLVLLLVSLASLTRVETQVAGNNQQLAQARQNALLALNIALGQLQKTAGPDQRITATADLAGDSSGAKLTDGTAPSTTVGSKKYWDAASTANGLGAVRNGTRYWTGIWGNADPSAPTATGNIYEKAPRPVILNWLVSGNESATFDTVSTPTATQSFGQVTNSNGGGTTTAPTYTPAGAVTGLSSSMTASTAVMIADKNGSPQPAVLLVGTASVGTDPHPTTSEAALDRYIVAPLVNLQSTSVPGMSGNQTVGHYAYWVGDEGVKARINLTDPYADKTDSTSDIEARYRLMTAPRSGLEAISDLSNSNYAAKTQSSTLSANVADRILDVGQLTYLDTTQLTAAKTGPRFHDFTTRSQGLLVDTLNGGLKKDLTYYLENTSLSADLATTGIIPAAYSPTNGYASGSDKRVPKWDVMHDFYQLSNRGTPSTPATIRPADDTHMGMVPVIVQTRLMAGFYADTVLAKDAPSADNIRGRAQVAVSPMVMLANPYAVSITTSQDLFVEFKLDENTPLGAVPTVFLRVFASTGTVAGNAKRVADDGRDQIPLLGRQSDTASWSVLGGVKFKIAGPVTFAAGEAKIFTMRKSFLKTTEAITAELVEATPSATNFYGVYKEYPFKRDKDNNPGKNAFNSAFGGGSGSYMQVYQRYDGDHRIRNRSCMMRMTLSREGDTAPLQVLSGMAYNQFNGNGVSNNTGQWSVNTLWPSFPTGTDPLEPGGGSNQHVVPVSCFTFSLQGNAENNRGKLQGRHNTTQRTYADFNLRASFIRPTKQVFSPAPYNWVWAGEGELNQSVINQRQPGATYAIPSTFTDGTVNTLWGPAVSDSDNPNGVSQVVLFDVPSRSSASEIPVFSIGQLQHANVTAETVPVNASLVTEKRQSNIAHQPGYAIGNSYSSPFLARDKSRITGVSEFYKLDGVATAETPATRDYYDMSYLLNTALWDGYYFSSIPQGSSAQRPANPRLSVISATDDTRRSDAARNQVVNGAFNINSTSEDAWAAVLAGMNNLPKLSDNDSAGTATVSFPRSIRQPGDWDNASNGDMPASFNGFRKFTPSEIRTLAHNIVSEVRTRGPFLSLAHFINRTLTPAATDSAGLGLSGPLQRAIDKAGMNPVTTLEQNQLAEPDKYSPISLIPDNSQDDDMDVNTGTDTGAPFGAYSIYHQSADGANTYKNAHREQHRSVAIPGWLTQADVLQAIGPIISARSDTFVIRTYGDVMNPVTGGTTPVARAWCEAVVQRLPDYVESNANSADVAPSAANNTNQTFGRRFKVVSFRWLGPEDI